MSSTAHSVKYMNTPLTQPIAKGLELAKLRAQIRNVRLSERQRIGRDGCVQAVLARFLMLSESEQDQWIDEGVAKLTEQV